jgi:integrase
VAPISLSANDAHHLCASHLQHKAWITEAQAQKLLKALPEHQREIVVFVLSTGLRQGNVLGLTWEQVHLDRRVVMIEHGDTKNGEALGVPLNDVAMAVLLRQQGKHKTSVFTYRGQPLRSANTRAWRGALAKSGITNFAGTICGTSG